jgi:TldD protein
MSEALSIANKLFHETGGLDPHIAARHLATALEGADDGELFLEYRESESISLDDGRIRAASFDTRRGFGLRAVLGEASYYAHAGELSDTALARAAATIKAAKAAEQHMIAGAPAAAGAALYANLNPLAEMPFATRAALLQEIDAYTRAADSRVTQVMANISGEWQVVEILRGDGRRYPPPRPAQRLGGSGSQWPPRIR